MTAVRMAVLVALFAVSFAVTRWIVAAPAGGQPTRSNQSPDGLRPPTGDRSTSSGERSESRGLQRTRTIEIGEARLTEWQRLIVSEPERAPRTRGMVLEELYRRIGDEGGHPSACLTGVDGLVGDYKLLFETQVSSRGKRVETSAWRFVRVLDGTPIPPDALACMEAMLATPLVLEGPPDRDVFLPSYDGPLEVEIAAFVPDSAE